LSGEVAFWPDPPSTSGAVVFNARALADANAPHPLAVGPALADGSRVCARCHQFDPLGSSTARPPLDTFGEHDEYRAGGGKETCAGCHMPEIERSATANAPVRTGHDHRFLGVRDVAFTRRFLAVEAGEDGGGIRVSLTNLAGHRVPTGEPARVLRVTVSLRAKEDVVAARTVRIVRDFDPIHLVDRMDSSLEVGERRSIFVNFAAGERAVSDRAVVQVDLLRYEAEHPLLHAVGPKASKTALEARVLTATVAFDESPL
jgi:hypothetical protein